mmetsp:Transcript_2281/g.5413  ORF Transcript_2281/g.5413 Transcript_2281/m.5413 type:complete len:101 (+) Transcript_2281:635-937(+)
MEKDLFLCSLWMSADGQDVLPAQKPSPHKSGCRQHAQKSSGLCTVPVRYPTAKVQIARFKKIENPLEFRSRNGSIEPFCDLRVLHPLFSLVPHTFIFFST